jgi:hypothetical protein
MGGSGGGTHTRPAAGSIGVSTVARLRSRFLRAALAAVVPWSLLAGWGGAAVAQSAAHFSPTYAASEGSPYSDIYARTFGAGARPLETAAPPAADTAGSSIVYVIEGGRLLTYSAEAYTEGGQAQGSTLLPPAETDYRALSPQVRVPTVADGLYGTPPLDTAAGPDAGSEAPAAPIPLLPSHY